MWVEIHHLSSDWLSLWLPSEKRASSEKAPSSSHKLLFFHFIFHILCGARRCRIFWQRYVVVVGFPAMLSQRQAQDSFGTCSLLPERLTCPAMRWNATTPCGFDQTRSLASLASLATRSLLVFRLLEITFENNYEMRSSSSAAASCKLPSSMDHCKKLDSCHYWPSFISWPCLCYDESITRPSPSLEHSQQQLNKPCMEITH